MTWLPVMDCLGRPETVAGYAIMLMAVWISGWVECDGGLCPVYARSDWMQVGFTEETLWPLPTPSLGGVDIYRVVSVDKAGNMSEDCL